MNKNKLISSFTSWRFWFFLIGKLPIAFIAGIRVKKLTHENSIVTVPFNFINKNPFNSMYFAVQAMAAELSTGCLVLLHTDQKNISTLVTSLEAKYYKKAMSNIQFKCFDGNKVIALVDQLNDNNNVKCITNSKGYDIYGNCVSEFSITWSLKKRRS